MKRLVAKYFNERCNGSRLKQSSVDSKTAVIMINSFGDAGSCAGLQIDQAKKPCKRA